MTAARRRVARSFRRCDGCDRGIAPGDTYLVHTDFPGSSAGYATHAGHPVRMAECEVCATRYGRAALLLPITERRP